MHWKTWRSWFEPLIDCYFSSADLWYSPWSGSRQSRYLSVLALLEFGASLWRKFLALLRHQKKETWFTSSGTLPDSPYFIARYSSWLRFGSLTRGAPFRQRWFRYPSQYLRSPFGKRLYPSPPWWHPRRFAKHHTSDSFPIIKWLIVLQLMPCCCSLAPSYSFYFYQGIIKSQSIAFWFYFQPLLGAYCASWHL